MQNIDDFNTHLMKFVLYTFKTLLPLFYYQVTTENDQDKPRTEVELGDRGINNEAQSAKFSHRYSLTG